MSDEMIKLLARNRGVIQMNFGAMFVNGRVNKEFEQQRKHVIKYIETHNLIA